MPISSDLACTDFEEVLEEVERKPGQMALAAILLSFGICLGTVLCRR